MMLRGKLLVVAVLVILNACCTHGRRYRNFDDSDDADSYGHGHHGNGRRQMRGWGRPRGPGTGAGTWGRRNMQNRQGSSLYSGFENMMERMFGRGGYSFGMGPRHDPWFGIDVSWGGHEMDQPWWKGPNVCFSRKESKGEAGENVISSHLTYHTQSCDGSIAVQKCVTTIVTALGRETVTETYECCAGYTRTEGAYGCDQEVDLYPMEETLKRLNLTEFLGALSSVGLAEGVLIAGAGNITVFATSNSAFHSYLSVLPEQDVGLQMDVMDMGVVMVSEQITETVVNNTRNMLLCHLAVGNFPSVHLENDQLIETASPYKTNIRINMYQRPVEMMTANCQPVTQMDQLASNGVVHVVDSMLPPVTATLQQLVAKEPQLRTLKTALGSSKTGTTLRESDHVTLLAPTDDAFKKVDQDLLARILNQPKCLENTLKNHMLPNVICSAIMQGETKTQNMLDKYINTTRDGDNKVFVNHAQIVKGDTMATNGVMHVIDDVLIPDEALGLLELAEKRGFTDFVELVNTAGLRKEFTNIEITTVFIPSNEAIQEFNISVLDNTELQNLLRYHVVPNVTPRSDMYNNLELDTLADSAKLRINEYSSFPYGQEWVRTAQCSQIEMVDIEGCNGVAHVINRVIVPPVGNVLDVLSRDSRFSILVKLIKMSDLGDELQAPGPFTLFAPTNDVFDGIGSDVTDELQDNRRLLKSVLFNHITKDYVCCAGIMEGNWLHSQKVRTYSNQVYSIGRDRSGGAVNIGGVAVTECDIAATNGVVHVIDNVLMRTRRRWQGNRRRGWGIDF